MGDHIYSKTKLGCSISHNGHISTKILSILLAILLVTTVFSSITLADDTTEGKNIIANILGDVKEKISSAGSKLGSRLRDFIDQIRENRKGLLSLSLVTRYQEEGSSTVQETSTRLRLLLPTSLDVNGDTKKDIRVWVIRRPAIDLRPPALCWKTSLIVRRLPGMDETMVDDFLEIYLEYNPRLLSRLSGTVNRLLTKEADTILDRIRIGYQSPMGEEIPKTCIVSHKDIPHLIYPREKSAHRVAINPFQLAGKSQKLNLLFSIADMQEDKVLSELSMQINHTPAVRNEFSIERSKDYFVRRGQTLVLSRKNVNSNVSLYIKEGPLGVGTLTVDDIPKKLSISWKLAREGYLSLDTHGSDAGDVKAAVKGVIYLGFDPVTSIEGGIKWKIPGVIGRLFGKKTSIEFSTDSSIILDDIYVNAPLFMLDQGLPNPVIIRDFSLDASRLKMYLKGNAGVGNFKILPSLHIDSITAVVNNVDVELENCSIDVEISTEERPTVTIESPQDGEIVSDIVLIAGNALAPDNKEIEYVQLKIDGNDWIYADYNCQTEKWSYEWDTNPLPNGDHTITAQSFDGEYFSLPETVTVTVDNEGNNWYPLISIDSPKDGAVVSGIVQIRGTARDPYGAVAKVEIRFKKGEWIEVTSYDETTGEWTYEWDTTSLAPEKYPIEARSFDGVIYSLEPATVQVSIKGVPLFDVLDFTLEEASITVKNFVISGLNNNNVTALEVPSLAVKGNGRLKISEDSIFAEAKGSLDINNASISVVNESGETIKLLDNLIVDADGYGMLFLAKSAISFKLNASVFISADGVLDLKNFTFSLNGEISAAIAVDESGAVALGGDSENDYFLADITDLVIEIEDIISMGAKQICINGTGNVSVVDGQLLIEGELTNCVIDELYINISSAVVSFSGSIDRVRNGALMVEFGGLFNFNISYDGETDLTVTDAEVKIRSSSGNVTARADSVIVRSDGYASFSYYKNDTEAEVWVNISGVYITGLSLYFDEFSYGPINIGWEGSFHFILSAYITIEQGEDWIRITIGGGGNIHIDIHTTLNFNGTIGPLDVVMDLATGDDVFVIYLYNLSSNIGLDINGSASVSIEELRLILPDIINISIERLTVGFDAHASGENGVFLLNIEDSGFALDGHLALGIGDLFNFLLVGTVDISMSGNASGTIAVMFNESGLTELSIDFDAYVMVDITDLSVIYNNTDSSTAVDLTADQIAIGGSGYIVITLDYISAGITTSGDGGSGAGASKKTPGNEDEGIVLKNFSLNATNLLSDINVIADIDFLQILGGLSFNYSGNITLDSSADVTGQNISLAANIQSMDTYISVQIASLEISGVGGGTVTIIDKNISLISGHATDIVVEGMFVDIVYPDMALLLILEEADISFTGVDAVVSIDFSDDMVVNAILSGDAHITINTLWAYLFGIELRLHSVYLDGPTTITATIEEDMLVTIYTEGTISAGEFTVSGFFNLYGLEGGPEISIGIDSLGDFLIGLSGSWHIDMIFALNMVVIPSVDFEGEIEHMALGFGGSGGPIGFDWLHIQGSVNESSTISLKGVKLILEPGEFIISVDGLSTMEEDEFMNSIPINIGVLIYLESPGKLQLGVLFDNFTLVEGRGYLEANFNLNSFEQEDIDIEIDAKWNGEIALLERRINITGEGTGNFALEAGGSLQNGDLYGSLQLDIEGTTYWTIFPTILPNPLLGVRFAVDREAHIDFDFGSDPDSGDFVIETNEETIFMTQEGETIVMNENGEIIYQSTQGNQGSSPLGGDGDWWELFDGDFYFWIWNPITQRWFPFWIEGPDLDASVTLLASEVGSNAIKVNSLEILPGDIVNFTAWYIPAEDSGGESGHYNFVFDYGDGSDPQVIPIDYSDGPIIVHPDEHLYTELDNYTVAVTVIDTADPDEAVADTIPVYVVEKYLDLSDNSLHWDYEDVADDGKLYGSFEVRNLANKTYSNNYILNWSIEEVDTMKWGTNWIFEPMSGSIEPENSTVVNVSFTPPEEKGDYKDANITVINDDKPEENKTLKFSVSYGLVELLPDTSSSSTVNLIIEKGQIKTFENVFWVYSNRWEELEWEITEVTLPDHLTVDYTPESGTIYPGDPLTSVALEIDTSDEEFDQGTITIKVERVGDLGDPNDNDTIHIFVKTISGGSGQSSDWVTPDGHVNNKWRREWRARDNKLNKAAYYNKAHGGWTQDYLILTLDSSISCSGFRINAKSGDHLEKMRVKLYRQGTEVDTTDLTSWANHAWEEVIFGSSVGQVDKVKINFKLEDGYTYGGLDPHWAVVWEFDFLKES